MIDAIALSIIAFTLFLITHWVAFHFFFITHRFRAVRTIFFIFLILYSLAAWSIPTGYWFAILAPTSFTERALVYLNGLLIYIFLFFSYAQFYFLIDRGVSARVMAELLQMPGGRGSFDDIRSKYIPEKLLRRRVDDMVYGGYVEEGGGVYRLTAKGMLHARVFYFFKKFIRLYPGG